MMRIAAALTTACYCLQVCVSVLLAVRQVAANDENCTEFMDTGGVLACLEILGGWCTGEGPLGGGVMDTGRVLACMQILGGRGR